VAGEARDREPADVVQLGLRVGASSAGAMLTFVTSVAELSTTILLYTPARSRSRSSCSRSWS
jgi:hypothetical protein